MDSAARAAVWGGFLNAGQVCTSVERVYVDQAVYRPFISYVVALTEKLVLGPGIEETSEITPMIRPEERDLEQQFGDEFSRYKASVRRWM